MPTVKYTIVDVFTDRPFGGNPLAVFAEGTEVPPELMQTIAGELNLSETTFVLPPADAANDHHVRIFTPRTELPIAGHPTIGTAFVLAAAHHSTDELMLRFEEGVGLVPVRVQFMNNEPDLIWMQQPIPTFEDVPFDANIFEELLSLPSGAVRDTSLPVQVGSCGTPFLFVPVRDLSSMRGAAHRPDVAARLPDEVCAGHVFLFTREVEHAEATVHSRMFAPKFGITEDPATGVASGPLGAYLVTHGLVTETPTARILSEQGMEMGRPSHVHIEVDHADGRITAVRVGGRCVKIGDGSLLLP